MQKQLGLLQNVVCNKALCMRNIMTGGVFARLRRDAKHRDTVVIMTKGFYFVQQQSHCFPNNFGSGVCVC